MKRILIFAIGFILVLATSGFAMHHGGGMKGGSMQHGHKWWQYSAVAQMINLSGEEESQVYDMWVEHRRKMIKLKANLHVEKFELEVLDDNKVFDAAAFKAQYEKMQKASTDVESERMNYQIEVRTLLGSDRFSQIRSLFPRSGKGKMSDGKGMKCGKSMMCGKGMAGSKMMGGKGGCSKMMGKAQKKNMESGVPKSAM